MGPGCRDTFGAIRDSGDRRPVESSAPINDPGLARNGRTRSVRRHSNGARRPAPCSPVATYPNLDLLERVESTEPIDSTDAAPDALEATVGTLGERITDG